MGQAGKVKSGGYYSWCNCFVYLMARRTQVLLWGRMCFACRKRFEGPDLDQVLDRCTSCTKGLFYLARLLHFTLNKAVMVARQLDTQSNRTKHSPCVFTIP